MLESTASPLYALRLYITGRSAHSGTAVQNLEVLQQHYLPDGADIDIVDLAQDSQRAEDEKILAPPLFDEGGRSRISRPSGST